MVYAKLSLYGPQLICKLIGSNNFAFVNSYYDLLINGLGQSVMSSTVSQIPLSGIILQLKKFEWTTMFLNLETGQLVAVGSVLGNAYQAWSTQRGVRLNIYSKN